MLLVGGYSGLGVHSLLTVLRLFPRYFKNVLFVTVGVVDSATFQGVEEVDRVREEAEEGMKRYVEHAQRLGLPAGYRVAMGTEAVAESVRVAQDIAREVEDPRKIVARSATAAIMAGRGSLLVTLEATLMHECA